MKKRYNDLTIEEAESLIKCRDKNGETLCRICNEKGLLTDESGDWEIDLERSEG